MSNSVQPAANGRRQAPFMLERAIMRSMAWSNCHQLHLTVHARTALCRHTTRLVCMCQAGAEQRPLVVVGSINADLVLKMERLPQPGETLGASSLNFFPGGKRANQAAAAAKLGWPTYMVGQLGTDSNAPALREALAAAGVKLDYLKTVPGPSGTAIILLQAGENSIIIVGGANQAEWELSTGTLQLIASAGAVLLQREIPEQVNVQVAEIASAAGVPVLLDAGGVDAPLSDALLRNISTLSPNETELQRLAGQDTDSEPQMLAAAAGLQKPAMQVAQHRASAATNQQLQRELNVLVKCGSAGSIMVSTQAAPPIKQPAIPAPQVVDTTGAGDCFTAATWWACWRVAQQQKQ